MKRAGVMPELEQLKSDLPSIRERAHAASPAETSVWSMGDRARFGCEIRWCIEASAELDARIKAVAPQEESHEAEQTMGSRLPAG
jgi:hypothetical protein